jgi:archaellum biogenesis ATPase FlaH
MTDTVHIDTSMQDMFKGLMLVKPAPYGEDKGSAPPAPSASSPFAPVKSITWFGDRERKEPEFADEHEVLVKGTLSMIVSEAGSGKTTFCWYLLKQANRAGTPVLVLDRENPESHLFGIIERLKIEKPERDDFKIWDNASPLGEPVIDARVWDFIKECNEAGTPPIILIDSLAAFTPGTDENSKEIRGFLDEWRKLVTAGSTVLVIHHSLKNDPRYRGFSGIRDAVDTLWELSNIPPGENNELGTITLRPDKSRLMVGQAKTFVMTPEGFKPDAQGLEKRSIEAKTVGDILRSVGDEGMPGTKLEEEAQAKKVTREVVRGLLADWLHAGWIHKIGNNRTTRYVWGAAKGQKTLDLKHETPVEPVKPREESGF